MEPNFACVDCKVDTKQINEYYMVDTRVWLKSGMGERDGMLCIGCLEKRLNRTLGARDFPMIPINLGAFPQSPRLINRIWNVS